MLKMLKVKEENHFSTCTTLSLLCAFLGTESDLLNFFIIISDNVKRFTIDYCFIFYFSVHCIAEASSDEHDAVLCQPSIFLFLHPRSFHWVELLGFCCKILSKSHVIVFEMAVKCKCRRIFNASIHIFNWRMSGWKHVSLFLKDWVG